MTAREAAILLPCWNLVQTTPLELCLSDQAFRYLWTNTLSRFIPLADMPLMVYVFPLVSVSGTHKINVRKFTAQNGQEYQWSWRVRPDQEWTVSPYKKL